MSQLIAARAAVQVQSMALCSPSAGTATVAISKGTLQLQKTQTRQSGVQNPAARRFRRLAIVSFRLSVLPATGVLEAAMPMLTSGTTQGSAGGGLVRVLLAVAVYHESRYAALGHTHERDHALIRAHSLIPASTAELQPNGTQFRHVVTV
jgi:hypothetical protein